MNHLDNNIRSGLATLADEMHSTPPPIHTITRLADTTAQPWRRRRRPLLIAAITGTMVIGVGTAAAVSLLGDGAGKFVDSADCGIHSKDARLIASGQDTEGTTIEFWIVQSPGGYGDLIVEKDQAGNYVGGMLGCGHEPSTVAHPAGQPWAGAPTVTSDTETLVRLFGWIPKPATSGVVTFSDGTTATVTPNSDGYFLDPITKPSDYNLGIVSIDALADDGTVIAHQQL